MKKLLLSLLSVTIFAFATSATEPLSIEFKKGSTDYDKISAYDKSWKSTNGEWEISCFNNNNNGWDFIAAGSNKAATKPAFATLKPSSAAITTIVASLGDRYNKAQIEKATLYVADNAEFTNAVTTDVLSALPAEKNSDMTVTVANGAAGQYIKVEFEVPKQGSNGQVLSLTQITINYTEDPSDLKPAGLSFSAATVTVTANKLEEFIAPTLTNPNNLSVTYSSSDENVADVAEDGTVTLTGDAGTAKITASFAGNDEFRAGEASYTITVKEAPKAVETVAATVELAANTEFEIGYDLTVAYAKGSNVFAYTADKEFIQLYGSNSYEVGDIIAKGWVGQYAPYNNGDVPEIKPVGAFPAAASKSEVTFVPAEVAAADVKAELVNHVIVVKGVTFATGTTAGKTTTNGTVGETTLAFYNSFGLAAQEAGIYNVTAVVQIYNGNVQLYPTAYELVEGGETPEPVEPEVTEVKTVAETIALADNTKVKIGYALTVGWKSYSNVFACDEAGDFIQLYGSNTLEAGDVIPAGWEATYKYYNSTTPELVDFTTLPEATKGTFTPKTVAAADITVAMVNSVVKIENVVFDAATPGADVTDNDAKNFTGKVGDVTVNLRNNYKLASVEAGKYNVTVVVTVFQNAPSLYVTNFEKVSTDGINELEADAAEAVYYNLQGVEVKNPENGVYIVRRGAKVTKEFIR